MSNGNTSSHTVERKPVTLADLTREQLVPIALRQKANPTRSTELDLQEPERQKEDGSFEPRHLRIDYVAMLEIHRLTGIKLWQFGSEWDKIDEDLMTMALVVTEALRHEDPEITVDTVLKAPGFDLGNLPYIGNQLSGLFRITVPPPEPKAEQPDPNGFDRETGFRQSPETETNGQTDSKTSETSGPTPSSSSELATTSSGAVRRGRSQPSAGAG